MTPSVRLRLNLAAGAVLLCIVAAAAIAAATRAHGTIVLLLMLAFAAGAGVLVSANRHAASVRRAPRELKSPATPFVAQRFARGERAEALHNQ